MYLREEPKFPDVCYCFKCSSECTYMHVNVSCSCVTHTHRCVTVYDMPCHVTHIYFCRTCERNHNDYIDVQFILCHVFVLGWWTVCDITLFYDIVILLTSSLQKDLLITCNHFKLQQIDPCLFGHDSVLFADWLLLFWRNLLTPSILKITASGLNVCK